MSLYNLVHGENPLAVLLLAMLGISREAVPRYRDCWWDGKCIAIHTRTGGGNRDFYDSEARCRENYPERWEGTNQPAGPWNDDLRRLPGYQYNEDDDFDSTYATFYYKPAETFAGALQQLQAADATPAQRWQNVFEKLQTGGTDDPQTERILGQMKPLLDAIQEAVSTRTEG